MQCNRLATLFGIILCNIVLQSHANGTDKPIERADLAQGAHDWANNCARCHNLRAPTEFSPDQWQLIMQHMRVQGGLTGQETRNISAFLMAQSATTQTPVTPAQDNTQASANTSANAANTTASSKNTGSKNTKPSGQSGSAVYHQTCAACHGANGKGSVPGAPDFTNKNGPLSKSDALLLQHIENGYQSPGSAMAMPARGGNPKLTDEDLKNTLTYIRQTFGEKK